MPPSPQVVVQRTTSLQYDGTNATAIVDLLTDQFPLTPNSYSVGDETDGVLTVITTDRDLWADIVVNEGDHVVVSWNGFQVTSDEVFTGRFVLLP